jgi:hypothetical protein
MSGNEVVVYDQARQREALQLLGIKGTAEHITLLFKLAEHYQLDVLSKEITLIPGKGPYIGVWGRLHIAHRSGLLDGLEMEEEEETDQHYKVRCVVWRTDKTRPAAKVVGRVGKHERKEWPWEIARSRAVRAALGFAFSIHDSFDDFDDSGDWVPAPDEPITATVIPREEEAAGPAAVAAPKRTRRVNKKTGEVQAAEGAPGPEDDNQLMPHADRSPRATGAASARVASPPPAPDTEPPTKVVGGHTLAQKIAIAARDAGCDDDDSRHDVITAATSCKYTTGSEIPDDDPLIPRILAAFAGLKDGTVELRYDPAGKPKLFKVKR